METKTFTVDNIGTFEFMPELPHTVFFMDTRKKMAAILGGIKNLLTLEGMRDESLFIDTEKKQWVPREGVDSLTTGIAYNALFELSRASNIVQMQDYITKYPTGKRIEQLSPSELSAVEQEFTKQLEFFRSGKLQAAKATTPSDELGNG